MQVPASESTIPRLHTAAFLVAERVRSTTDLDSLPEANEDTDVARLENASRSRSADDMPLSEEDESAASDPPESALSGELPVSAEDPADNVVEPAENDPVALPEDHSQPTPVVERSPPVQESERPQGATGPDHDAILGVTTSSPQYGCLVMLPAEELPST